MNLDEKDINKDIDDDKQAEDVCGEETISEKCCDGECGCGENSGEGKTEEKEDSRDDAKKKKKSELAALREEAAHLKIEIERAEAALKASEEKCLRIGAEYDNFRKRSQKEKEETYAGATASCISGLLPLIDNLKLASKYTEGDKVAEGVKMILDSLPGVLSGLNITSYGAAGDKFDPNIHNAVMHIEDEAYGEGEIVDVFQEGYMFGDKIIRHAMVRVAN